MTIRWKRWAIGAASAVGVYAVAGFWLVPSVIKSQLPKYAQTELERKASIGALSFNPFTLRLEAQDVRLTEANDAPLFAVGGLAVEMQWRSLFRRAFSFAEIRITEPAVQLAIAKDGKFNIAEFLATLDKHKKDEPDSGMPRLVIEHFVLDGGKVAMHDQHAGYNDTFAPITFALNNLSTLPDENGDYTLSADAGLGGKLRWKGVASVNPIGGSGLLTLENVSLPGMAAYLKSFSRIVVADGKLSAQLPYKFAYKDGKLDASLAGAGLSLNALSLRRGIDAPFVQFKQLAVSDVGVDLLKRSVQVGGLQLNGGALAVRRDARGELDVAGLMLPAPAAAPAPGRPAATSGASAGSQAAAPAAKEAGWKVQFKQIGLDSVALSYVDETVSPVLKVSADKAQLKLGLLLDGSKLMLDGGSFSMDNVAMNSGSLAPLKLSRIGFDEASLDLAARKASVGRLYADGGQLDLSRDAKGQFLFMAALPGSGAGAPAAKAAPAAAPAKSAAGAKPPVAAGAAPARTDSDAAWVAEVKSVELNKFGARYDDASTGIKVNLQDFNLKVRDAGTDLKKPLAFDGSVGLREGGQLVAKGKVVPSTGAVDTELKLSKLALAPVQPLLAKYVKLKIADGAINAQGRLRTGAGGSKADPALRYDGAFEVAELSLNEEDNDRFAHWKSVRADTLALSLKPDLLDVAELRIVEPNAILIIENDRSFNAQRLLVQQQAPVATPAAPAAAPASEPFPIRMRRVRVQNAKLDFTDLSLRPQFAAKIYELNGVVTGLSSKRDARSQIELDGRVDDYGLARVRGQLNPFVPADNTDLNVIFKNVDMVSASPYSMKFAGYKIAEGKISLDLQYKVRNNQLEGNNQVVLDNLTLGERIDSPDALKLPLELALAILKDSNGRIDLGIPVSGNMNDPSFSYGAVVWKALGNIMSKVVTAPFRALGNLFGVSGDKLEAVEFDAGSDVVLPPEREKLQQIAKILARKPELRLAVPAVYSEAADGAALRAQALRRAVLARADIKLAAGEAPGPLDIGQRKIRGALRDLYAERFGAAELDKQKKAAETAGGGSGAEDAATKKLPVLQRLGKMVQGEPQVADATAFYDGLQARLEQNQPLAKDALPQLGAQRAAAVLAVLKDAGVSAATASATAPAGADGGAGKPVALKLELSAK
ncbi:DUF748 domain-containing protein [Duganella radicis]|uniref:DUF748 domain-containing protein n=1 Tax=Duganella radicis TaxID=551988 RepID=A0A6L6PQ60_9BURK|nr:DUF748 domain-containing protein [Duganella radicis]MTV40929.1 DUF748 domain-containing protein [Duganella radicis]